MTTFHIKIDQIMNIFNINAVPRTTRSASPGLDTAIKYCEDSHKQTVMIISVGLNPGGGQVWGSWLLVVFHLWSGLVWSGDPADNLFTIWFLVSSLLSALNLPSYVGIAWQPAMSVPVCLLAAPVFVSFK